MPDLRRVSTFAIVFLVLLRISIGWQMLYEGLWKLDSYNTPRPWTAEGYLENAHGPFRDVFRNMTGDPDDRDWLDYDKTAANWDQWRDQFVAHYGLDETQRGYLNYLLDGPENYTVAVENPLPAEQMDALISVYPESLQWDAENQSLSVKGNWHLTPEEYKYLESLLVRERDKVQKAMDEVTGGQVITKEYIDKLKVDDNKKFLKLSELNASKKQWQSVYDALTAAYEQNRQLSYKRKLAASLKGDTQRVTQVMSDDEGQPINETRVGEIDIYLNQLARYEEKLKTARTGFDQEHLKYDFARLQEYKTAAVGPVKALDAGLKADAQRLLTDAQRAKGPVYVPTPLYITDQLTIWSLIVLGGLLIFGLFSRLGAVLSAGMILSFYLVWPPWPGVPEPPGVTEHSFIVNKNLIEVFALLALACLPSGHWFGVDGLLRSLWPGRRSKLDGNKSRAAAETSAPEAPAPEAKSKKKSTARTSV